jgi:hypothetical protein
MRSAAGEVLLAAVDVVGRARERRVGHEVQGEGGAARRADLARGLLQPLRIARGEDDLGAFGARARRAVSSPMPALPPITTTVCPRSSGSRRE